MTSLCYQPLYVAKVIRDINGKDKSVFINGAKECRNPFYPRRICSYMVRSRDTQAALTILVSEASILLSLTERVLGPFSRITRPSEVQQLLAIQDHENDEEFEETDSDQE
ncbi:hypothetical protein BGZ47_011660 [Haplosporangium gracile]|nr:hypothetical protein BGZ47_011660 [Haplosporangium gracile]